MAKRTAKYRKKNPKKVAEYLREYHKRKKNEKNAETKSN